MYSNCNDNELMDLLKSGDDSAFTAIYNRYWKKLLAIAYNHTKDKADAEEIVQEVFVSLWNKRATQEVLSLNRYLATATKFTVFNMYYRKRKRMDNVINTMPFKESYDITDQLNAKFLQEQIDGIVSLLPEKCRMVFKYSRESGFNIREIALKMDIADKTVEAHLSKALKTIKSNISEFGMFFIFVSLY